MAQMITDIASPTVRYSIFSQLVSLCLPYLATCYVDNVSSTKKCLSMRFQALRIQTYLTHSQFDGCQICVVQVLATISNRYGTMLATGRKMQTSCQECIDVRANICAATVNNIDRITDRYCIEPHPFSSLRVKESLSKMKVRPMMHAFIASALLDHGGRRQTMITETLRLVRFPLEAVGVRNKIRQLYST
ncbi:uncharacterized protein BT62DRAFT_1010729 [Guyanagaster necrorhizus]|uniref:Uncharacterized protein n=1 Tax=Guyanagaster necrorhizus TaxID=856835 RepID=A0A9P8APT5_9AGAR|nr:uncharacterized protein BT62DRAFT_1010729 [Guyanagaster necrorhizus MCA 3950]KAG7442192.1 hypothetical protein BT62DRAFT_1010729 [Guyanagaster necrorhizus MCA 3950]